MRMQNILVHTLNVITFLDWLYKFGLAKNILEPVEGQGISFFGTENVLFTFNKDLLMHYSAKEIVKFTPFQMEYKSLALN